MRVSSGVAYTALGSCRLLISVPPARLLQLLSRRSKSISSTFSSISVTS